MQYPYILLILFLIVVAVVYANWEKIKTRVTKVTPEEEPFPYTNDEQTTTSSITSEVEQTNFVPETVPTGYVDTHESSPEDSFTTLVDSTQVELPAVLPEEVTLDAPKTKRTRKARKPSDGGSLLTSKVATPKVKTKSTADQKATPKSRQRKKSTPLIETPSSNKLS